MSYKLKVSEKDVLGVGKYANAKGHTECVVFVQSVTDAPNTSLWTPGTSVADLKVTIPRGTAIATFDDKRRYPVDGHGKHAAIFLERLPAGIRVLDQWNAQGEVKERIIRFNNPGSRSNNASTFYVIE